MDGLGGKGFLVLSADLGMGFPLLALQHAHEEEFRGGGALSDGFRLSAFDGLDEQDAVAETLLGDHERIALAEFMTEPHLAHPPIAFAAARARLIPVIQPHPPPDPHSQRQHHF